ncbi:MAG: ribosome maturation factor RimM [Ktedonobacterales bacterium]
MTASRDQNNQNNNSHADSTNPPTSSQPRPIDEEWVVVGEFVGPFGIHGEVKLRPITDFPERFERTPTLYVGDKHVPYRVEQAHMHKQLVLLRLAGITDVDAAEQLRGAQVWIPATELTPLQEDQFYLHDVVGLRVQHVNGRPLGVVTDVVSTGASELFVIRDPQGKEVLLPVVKSFVKQIDLAQGIILVDPIPGLFDENYEEDR